MTSRAPREARLPQAVADHDDIRTVRDIFLFRERPADDGPNAQDVRQVVRDELAVDADCVRPVGDVERRVIPQPDAVERTRVLSPRVEVRIVHADEVESPLRRVFR